MKNIIQKKLFYLLSMVMGVTTISKSTKTGKMTEYYHNNKKNEKRYYEKNKKQKREQGRNL